MAIIKLIEKIFIWVEALVGYLAAQRDKKRIQGAKDEAKKQLDQRPLESLTGDSGGATRHEYPGLQHGPKKDRSDSGDGSKGSVS